MVRYVIAIILLTGWALPLNAQPLDLEWQPTQVQALGEYVVLAWNDLGMHCMNQNFETLCILPPYNTLWAQVIRRGDPPQLLSEGITLLYEFTNNTSSADKVNFWDYEDRLFNVNLEPDTGLAGNGLTGQFNWNGLAFEAIGIPLTPFEDAAPAVERPYQVAVVTAVDSETRQVLDRTEIVAPVSVEMHCEKCHQEDERTTEEAILEEHDEVDGKKLTELKPVLCAGCHQSNALGTEKKPGIPALSEAIHGKHAEEAQEEGLTIGCYDCHPGTQTQCLRDVMYTAGKTCQDCHGNLAEVARSIRQQNRRPWLDEPTCASCHASDYAENPDTLYRQSIGHSGLFCAACHNSPHAILPSVQPRDNAQAIRVQGVAKAITDCRVCHTVLPTNPGAHHIFAQEVVRVEAWSLFD